MSRCRLWPFVASLAYCSTNSWTLLQQLTATVRGAVLLQCLRGYRHPHEIEVGCHCQEFGLHCYRLALMRLDSHSLFRALISGPSSPRQSLCLPPIDFCHFFTAGPLELKVPNLSQARLGRNREFGTQFDALSN